VIIINSCCFLGRLTRDPDLKENGDFCLVNFGLAVNRNYVDKKTGKRETDFFEFTAFNGTAKFIRKYFGKGSMVAITSTATTSNWKDKEGNNRSATKFIVQSIDFADSAKKSSENTGQKAQSQEKDGFMDIPTDTSFEAELPFR
jgi:single-strand DNA-binding protein